MDVVWHDHPSEHLIPFAVEMQERAFDHFGDGRVAKVTGAVPLVDVRFRPSSEFRSPTVLGQPPQFCLPSVHDMHG